MTDVFISYRSVRVRGVSRIADMLQAYGYTVWFDVRGIERGASFGPQIEAALRNAKAVLVLWCRLARDSQWVGEEAALAKRLGKYLPAHMEDEATPLGFQSDQALKLENWNGDPLDGALQPLLSDLEKLTGKAPSPDRAELELLQRDWVRTGRMNYLDIALDTEVPNETNQEREWTDEEEAEDEGEAVEGPSTRLWREVRELNTLDDYEAFLAAFPGVPEAENCRHAIKVLKEQTELQEVEAAKARLLEERKTAFDTLPVDGEDPEPFDRFIEEYPNTAEAFRAAKMRKGVIGRVKDTGIDDETRTKWEQEAVIALVLGEPIPEGRIPFIENLDFSGGENPTLGALKARGVNLSDFYYFKKVGLPGGLRLHRLPSENFGIMSLKSLTIRNGVVPEGAFLEKLENIGKLEFTGSSGVQKFLDTFTGEVIDLLAGGTDIVDLVFCERFSSLEFIDIYGTSVEVVDPLAGHLGLQKINLYKTPVTSVGPLGHLVDLGVRCRKGRDGVGVYNISRLGGGINRLYNNR